MSISERLKLVCQEKNWKLKDFSETTGLPYRTAQGYLNGTREPNAEGLSIICSKAKVNLNWLLNGYGMMFLYSNYGMQLTHEEETLLITFRQSSDKSKKILQEIGKVFLDYS